MMPPECLRTHRGPCIICRTMWQEDLFCVEVSDPSPGEGRHQLTTSSYATHMAPR